MEKDDRAQSQRRTNSCDQCRKLHVKCDKRLPVCLRCEKFERECTGLTETVFLNIINNPELSRQKKRIRKRKEPPPNERPPGNQSVAGPSFIDEALSLDTRHGNADLQDTVGPLSPVSAQSPLEQPEFDDWAKEVLPYVKRLSVKPRIDQMDDSYMWTTQFVSSWASMARTSGVGFVTLEPMSPGRQPPSIEKSFLAISLAYYGRVSKNRDATIEAYRIYGSSLRWQKKHLESSRKEKNAVAQLQVDVCHLIALSCFELVANFGDSLGLFQHLRAAERMLADVGPEACRSGDLNKLFRVLRTDLVYQSIRSRQPSIFAQKEWMTVPFEETPHTIYDRIMDAGIVIPVLFERFDALKGVPSEEAERALILQETKALFTQLENLAKIIVRETGIGQRAGSTPHEWYWEAGFDKGEGARLSPSANMILAGNATGQLLVLSILMQLEPEPAGTHHLRAVHISSQLLFQAEALAELKEVGIWSAAIEPLRTVYIVSPDESQQQRAKRMLMSFTKREGLGAHVCKRVVASLDWKPQQWRV